MREIRKTISEFVGKTSLPIVLASDMVSVAVRAMESTPSDCAVVVRDNMVVGVFTVRDFLNRIAAQGRDPNVTAMAMVMTEQPETLRPYDCISYAINRMVVRGFRNVPVVDDNGRPLAILTVRDVVTHLSELFDGVTAGGSDPELEAWVDIGGG